MLWLQDHRPQPYNLEKKTYAVWDASARWRSVCNTNGVQWVRLDIVVRYAIWWVNHNPSIRDVSAINLIW